MRSCETTGGVLCVLQARTGSTRLPGKVLQDLAGRPLLAFMLERLRQIPVDALVVATSTLTRDDAVVDIVRDAGVAVVRGPESDVLERYGMCLDTYPADTVVRLTADCPLLDPQVLADVLALHTQSGADFTSNVLPRTFPRGLDVEVASAQALTAARREAASPAEREHVMPFLYRHPERFRLANLRCEQDLGDERWTVDTEADLAFLRQVVGAFDGRSSFHWRDVLHLFGRRFRLDAGEVHLRPARQGDAELLLAWRNDADAVRFSGTGTPVDSDEHLRWLRSRLDDPATALWVAEVDGREVGSARVDVRNAAGVVSIAVDPAERGKGVGTAVLTRLLTYCAAGIQVDRLVATVDPRNVASLQLFQRVGFVREREIRGQVVLTWRRREQGR